MLDNPARRAADARMGRPPIPFCPHRRALFLRAVEILGGRAATAQGLNRQERTVANWIAGNIGISDDAMADVRRLLIARRQQAADLGAEIRAHLATGHVQGAPTDGQD